MKNLKSPNHNERSAAGIKYLILHYTGMATSDEAIKRLCNEEAGVSAHYVIEENGDVFQLVEENRRAWHAGVSKWEDDTDINDRSIGIELVNTGHSYPDYASEYKPFPEAQMEALLTLSKGIVERHNIEPRHVIGHSDVAWRRKIDPGELFDWKRLSENGVGSWPQDDLQSKGTAYQGNADVDQFVTDLNKYGYDTEVREDDVSTLISAFQRHFRQNNIDGTLDGETMRCLESLLLQKN